MADKVMGRKISVSALIGLRGCVKTLPFSDLGLSIKDSGRIQFFQNMKIKLAKVLVEKLPKEETLIQMQKYFDAEYKESFFDFHVQYETSKEKDFLKVSRFLNYYYENGYEGIANDVSYEVPINAKFRGEHISNVYGKADMVLKTAEGYLAVMLRTGEPDYSYGARKIENKVSYSLELLFMYLGLCQEYSNLSVAIFYLKNKDDRGSSLVECFENRRGKNVVLWNYESRENARELLSEAVMFGQTPNCEQCYYADLCQLSQYQSCQNGEAVIVSGVKEKKYSKTPSQERVIYHKDGPMNVIAVPGSGKTFCLVQRVCNLLQNEQVSPEEVLFVTFTQKAAGEIKERVSEALGGKIKLPNIFTFNALGYSILREHPEKLKGRFRLADRVDRYQIIEKCLEVVPQIKLVSYDGITGEFGLLNMLDYAIEYIQKNGIDVYEKEYGGKRDVAGIKILFDAYTEEYRKGGYITYDDQILLANELLSESPNVLKEYQKRYRFVMVDEFQDVSEPQKELIYSIAAHGNIVVVGDDDQTIYSWRGGSNRFMLNFSKDWPTAKTVIMEDNFRSVDWILEATNALISNNRNRYSKKVLSHVEGKCKPAYMTNFTNSAMWDVISAAVTKGGYNPGDIAVIARTNKELFAVRDALSPYVEAISPRVYVIEDAVFQSIYDVLFMYYNGITDREFYRFLVRNGVDCSCKTVQSSLYESLILEGTLRPIVVTDISCLPEYEDKKDESPLMHAGYLLISCFKKIQYAKNPKDCLAALFQILFAEEVHPVLDVLVSKADERAIQEMRELYFYLSDMIRYRDMTEIEYPVRREAVNLVTAHKSKGKEYPMVIVVGTERFEDTEEGRCLLYVAMTRAKKTLYLTQGPQSVAPLLDEFKEHVTLFGA